MLSWYTIISAYGSQPQSLLIAISFLGTESGRGRRRGELSACMCSSLADESEEGSRKFELTRSVALLPSESPRALHAILPSTGTQRGLKHSLHVYL